MSASSLSVLLTRESTPGGGAQLADGFYYASGGYNVALTLYQLWPVNTGGRDFHTRLARRFHFRKFAWRLCTGSNASLRNRAMRKDISKAATIFLRENSR